MENTIKKGLEEGTGAGWKEETKDESETIERKDSVKDETKRSGKETSDEQQEQKSWKNMPESYRDRYRAMMDAWESFLHDMLCPSQAFGMPVAWVRDQILRQAFRHIWRFRNEYPTGYLSKKEAGEEPEKLEARLAWLNKQMDRMRRMFTASVEYDWKSPKEEEKLLEIGDLRAQMFESRGRVRHAKNMLDLIAKMETHISPEEKLLQVIFGYQPQRDDETRKKIQKYLDETSRYFQAVEDFADDPDNLPDEYYDRIDAIFELSAYLNIFVQVLLSVRDLKKAVPKTMEERKQELYDVWRFGKMELIMQNNKIRESLPLPQVLMDAMDEFKEIYTNPDNFTGYHVNHIESGKNFYVVLGEKNLGEKDGVPMSRNEEYGEYPTKEEAEARAKEVQEQGIGTNVRVSELPTEEYYALIKNEDNSIASHCLFPTELEAYAVLYARTRPECYAAYREYVDKQREEKAEGTNTETEVQA